MNIKSLCIAIACTVTCVFVFAQSPTGEIKPGPLHHTPESALGLISQAQVGLPTSVTGGGSLCWLVFKITQAKQLQNSRCSFYARLFRLRLKGHC